MILVGESNLFFIRKCKEDFCKLLKQAHAPMLTLSVKTSKDHPLPLHHHCVHWSVRFCCPTETTTTVRRQTCPPTETITTVHRQTCRTETITMIGGRHVVLKQQQAVCRQTCLPIETITTVHRQTCRPTETTTTVHRQTCSPTETTTSSLQVDMSSH